MEAAGLTSFPGDTADQVSWNRLTQGCKLRNAMLPALHVLATQAHQWHCVGLDMLT